MNRAFEATQPAPCYLDGRPTVERLEVRREKSRFTPAGVYVLPLCAACVRYFDIPTDNAPAPRSTGWDFSGVSL